jgi:hypothetical protein
MAGLRTQWLVDLVENVFKQLYLHDSIMRIYELFLGSEALNISRIESWQPH